MAWLLPMLPLALLLVAISVSAYRSFQPAVSGDYAAHLDYLRYLDQHHSLPRADQGFEMYHPPLYYIASVVAAHVVRMLHPINLADAARAVATGAWVLEGIVAAAVVSRLRGSWLAAAIAAGVVWVLPGQANVATRIYPETTVGLGVGLLVLGVATLAAGRRSGAVWLGLGVPVAALSKFSGLLAVGVAVAVALWAFAPWRRRILAAVAPGAALTGAFYLRNVALFGTPTPLNADLFHLKSLGGDYAHYPPGFFTTVSLGKCAAHESFYGSVWKWFWATDCGTKAPWRNVVTGGLLVAAVGATVVCLAALVWALATGRHRPELLALGAIPVATFLAFLAYNVRVPSGSAGLYLLVAAVPAAAATGLLLDRLATVRWRWPCYALLLIWSVVMAQASGVLT